ncbi:GMC family oxidoreductase [Legionella drancourtii]|uniref:Alcohol/choline dehydrogenase n=1 Tax=Legionella drancourtii LLAP12 TaxID=658187 RepID=G9EM38_9GAMM|nr:choline dehydrogenase [Legionella drancourtii]EHL31638.1 alcohol/choline dehydrogenase [Legionella drancourtii LLAP12]
MKHFDYIIIGGGSAGCVLANRLSADSSNQVCLLESGPKDHNPFIKIPMGIIMVLRSKKLNWHYWTTPQIYCNNQEIYWPRGRTLGGSSSINAMCYVRGNPDDYDQWASLGNKGWSYQEVLPYFKKMEHFEPGHNTLCGQGGPINVSSPLYMNPLMPVFIKAGQQAGYAKIENYNTEHQEGVAYFYVAQKNGQRWSNARGYLHPIQNRTNLTVITAAHATQIIFEKKRAVGVRYYKSNSEQTIFADKEVILAAGTIGSPQLLLLSGIGPKAEIEQHGIPLVHDLPGVGENLQDHLDIHITCKEKTRNSFSLHPSSLGRQLLDAYQYIFKKRGELTSNYTQATGFIKSDPQLSIPNLQWHFGAAIHTRCARVLKPLFTSYGYTLMTCLLHPKSRGRIRLRSKNPMDYPLIDPNYLENPDDLDALVIGFKKAREILAQPAFSPYLLCEVEPGSQCQTDEEIRQYIRAQAESIYHPIGTCKMGNDAMAVVDPVQLKVHGIDNLRVIDASIMPRLVSGNTNAPTTMIAEKGADIILGLNCT